MSLKHHDELKVIQSYTSEISYTSENELMLVVAISISVKHFKNPRLTFVLTA